MTTERWLTPVLRSYIRPISSLAMFALVVASCGTSDDEPTSKAPDESPTVDTSASTAYGTVADVTGPAIRILVLRSNGDDLEGALVLVDVAF